MQFDDKIGLKNSINEILVIKENRHKTGIKQRKNTKNREKQNINTFKIGLKYTKDRNKGGIKVEKIGIKYL